MLFSTDIPDNLKPGQAILDVPMTELIRGLGLAVAEAQVALDANSVKIGQALGTTTLDFTDPSGKTTRKNLLELGFTPTFYHFTTANLSINVTISLKVSEDLTLKGGINTGEQTPKDKADEAAKAQPAVAATGSIGIDDITKLSAGDTISIGGDVIEIVETVDTAKSQVKLPAEPGTDTETKAKALTTEIVALINNASKPFAVKVKATADDTDVKLEAKVAGANGNQIALKVTTKTADALSVSADTLEGGKNEVKPEPAKPADGALDGAAKEVKNVLKLFGISASAEYHRKFGVDTTSTTHIDTTLVSVPAPKELFDLLKSHFGAPAPAPSGGTG